MIREIDPAVLTRDVPEHALVRGDVGTAVYRSPDGLSFDVEFVTAEGRTVTVLRLDHSDVRPMIGDEILHVRSLGATPV
ncbi:MAG TPA: DUF4926 domain-containing protein [Longimicrobiales bacterium]|nr:DUF4926 domain-containing protein [Longimicrobiales bacterium]